MKVIVVRGGGHDGGGGGDGDSSFCWWLFLWHWWIAWNFALKPELLDISRGLVWWNRNFCGEMVAFFLTTSCETKTSTSKQTNLGGEPTIFQHQNSALFGNAMTPVKSPLVLGWNVILVCPTKSITVGRGQCAFFLFVITDIHQSTCTLTLLCEWLNGGDPFLDYKVLL